MNNKNIISNKFDFNRSTSFSYKKNLIGRMREKGPPFDFSFVPNFETFVLRFRQKEKIFIKNVAADVIRVLNACGILGTIKTACDFTRMFNTICDINRRLNIAFGITRTLNTACDVTAVFDSVRDIIGA